MQDSRGLAVAVLVLASLAAVACDTQRPGAERPAGRAALAPDPTPVSPAEVPGLLASRRGKVVLVNLWASWCLPCREEFPDLLRLHRELAPRGLELVLISADFTSQRQAARDFLSEQGVDFVTFQKTGNDQDFIDAVDPSWSGSLPATVLVKRDGTRTRIWEGKSSFEEFRNAVEPLL